jgi:ABC-type multidrug transport system ATPase subunit
MNQPQVATLHCTKLIIVQLRSFALLGLDSLNAHQLVSNLRDYVQMNNATVISTIHQPQKKTFELFDSLTLLRHGRIAYQGPIQSVRQQVVFPLYSNLITYVFRSATTSNRLDMRISKRRT